MQQVVAVGVDGVAAQLRVRRGGPHVRGDAPLVGEQLLGLQRPREAHPGAEDLGTRATGLRALLVAVEAAQEAFHVQVLGLGRLHVRLVVDRHVVEDVLGVLAVHPPQAVLDDVRHLERPRRVVRDHGRVRVRQQQRVAVRVLQALTGERGAARGGAEHEAARHLVRRRPQAVARALESEHRVEDVDRDHRLALRRVGRADRRERRRGTRLVDALVQDLALLGLLVGEHQVGVHRGVRLAVRVVDLLRREHGVHAERPCLVRDDRDDARADLRVLREVADEADERHRRGDLLLARTAADAVVDLVAGQHEGLGLRAALRHETTQLTAALQHVLDLLAVLPGVVVRRQVRVLLEHLVGDRDAQAVPEALEVVQGHLLHLVRRVARREVLAERVALDGLGEDDGRLADGLGRRLVGRVDLAVVVAAALEVPHLVVAHGLDERLRPRVAAEEVLLDVRAVVRLVGLVVTVGRGVHQVDERAVAVRVQQRVPLAAPDDLDDVPAGAAEERLQLLDDLAVAAHRPVEALQVAVDHEREVVELLVRGELQQAARLRLVHLAVAEERPHVLVGRVLEAAVAQVAVEPGLVDRVHRADAHGDRGELPEVRHQARVRVRRQAATRTGVRILLAEAVELVLAQAALEERSRVDTGGGVALDEDLVAAAGVVLAAEEVVEADLVERRAGGVRRNVATDTHTRPLRAVHRHRGVPADPRAVAALHLLVTREPRLPLGGDGVDVVRAGQRGHADVVLTRTLQQTQHQVPGPLLTATLEHLVERLEPLGRLFGVDVRQVRGHAVTNDTYPLGAGVLRAQGVSSASLAVPRAGSENRATRSYRCPCATTSSPLLIGSSGSCRSRARDKRYVERASCQSRDLHRGTCYGVSSGQQLRRR